MIPYITSIPHTWTRTLIAILETTNYHHVHAEGTWQRVKEAELVISPMRKPQSVWRSWWRRGKHDNGLPIDEFWGCWMLMDKYDREREILYVPIDHPDRDSYWSRMCKVIGKNIEPKWGVVNGREDSEVDGRLAPSVDLSSLYEYAFVKRIYGVDNSGGT